MGTLMGWRMEVLREVFRIPEGADTSGLEDANRAYYEDALAHGRHVAVLAEEGGEVVGCGGLCLHDELPSPDNPGGRCGYVMNMYVRERWRGRGIGSAMLERLLEEASARGVGRILLEDTEDATGMYERLGFSRAGRYMEYLGPRGGRGTAQIYVGTPFGAMTGSRRRCR